MQNHHIRKYTIIISLIIHLLFLLSYNKFHALALFNRNNLDELLNEQEKEIVFEFDRPELVETPDDANQEKPREKTNLVSDKYSVARDNYQNKDKEIGTPYAMGDFDVKNLDQIIPQPQQQENQSSQNQVDDRNKPDNKQAKDYPLESYSTEKFSRQALLGKNTPPAPEQILHRPKYDSQEFNAEDVGGLAFNTYAWDFAPYMLDMKRKVEKNVFPPPAFTHMGLISGKTIVRFKVMPNGELRDLQVLKYEGHKSLMETSVQAIENSAPFKPLPPDFPENFLEVTATFSYFVKR